MRIALAGNPNSGKTTMYNALTGKNEKVGNWAGVTVEKNQYAIKKAFRKNTRAFAVDLPGTYSISPFTSEECVTSSYILEENPDVIINIVDATNLSRSLFFTTQLLELGIPVVVALNKSDINDKKNTTINAKLLSELLGCPVIQTVSTKKGGLKKVVQTAISLVGTKPKAPFRQNKAKDEIQAKEQDKLRFAFVNDIVSKVEKRKILSNIRTTSDKIDYIITNRLFGIPLFAIVMFFVFQISQSWLGTWIAEGYTFKSGKFLPGLVTLIDAFGEFTGTLVQGAHPLLVSLLVDGIIGGVGAVVGFLPLVMVMYFLIALLEDCGYMARVSVILDPIFKKVGLSGKSVIPFIIGTGCSIPGIMACRTIKDVRERRATAMITPFMPCGAKLPVIALFSGVFFNDAKWIGTLMYFVGILLILVCALIINKITGAKKGPSFFIIELPEYKLPSLKRACFSMISRGWGFIVKAGTVILVCNAIIQIMQSFTPAFTPVADGFAHTSILAHIASPIAVLLIPLGFGIWQMAAATVSGFVAKENVVGTLAVCFSLTNFVDTDQLSLVGSGNEVAAVFGITKAAALSCLVFNLFSPPCFAAIGAMNSEISDKKWVLSGILLQLSVGYSIAFLVYQLGTLITYGTLGDGFIYGLLAVALFAGIIIHLSRKPKKDI